MCDEIYTKSIICEDIETTISLPSKLPERSDSKSLEDYKCYKELEPEAELTDITDKMIIEINNINFSLDEELAQLNTHAIEELRWIMDKADEQVDGSGISIHEAITLLKQNMKICTQLKAVMNEMYQDLASLDKRRCELIQGTVSNKLLEIERISTGAENKRFSDVVRQLNVNMLQSMQRSEDLKLKLEIEGQVRLKKYQDKLKQQIWLSADGHAQHVFNLLKVKQNKRMALDAVFSSSEESSKTQESFIQVTNNLLSNLTEFAAVLELPRDCEENEDLWKLWNDTLNKKLGILSILSKNVENIMKTAVSTLLESFNEKINLLNRAITAPTDEGGLQKMSKQSIVLTNEIDEFKANNAEELKNLQDNWHNIFITLDKKTKHTKNFIIDLTSLWTNHLSRVDKFKKSIEEALTVVKLQCEKEDKDKSIKLKSHTKSLREAKDLDKLNQVYIILEKCFDDISKLWNENMQFSLKLIDEMTEKEIGHLVEKKKADGLQFLEVKYPKSDLLSEKLSLSSGSVFEKQIVMCNTYMTAVSYRTLGLYEMLERYLLNCDQAIREEINEFLEMIKIDTFNEYQNHITMIQELHTKTLQETKQIRYAELKVHSERLSSHSSAVKLILEDISKEYNEVKLNQQTKLVDFSEKLNTATINSCSQTSWALKRAIYDLELEWKNLSELLLNNIATAKNKIEEKFKMLQCSNEMFQKIPKHFNKGGNYSPEEMKILNKELKLLEKLFKSQQKSVANNFNALFNSISENILDGKLSDIRNKLATRKMEESVIDHLNITRQRLKFEIGALDSLERALRLNINQLTSPQELDHNKLNEVFENMSILCDKLRLPSNITNLECAIRVPTNTEHLKEPYNKTDQDFHQKLLIHNNEINTVEENNFQSYTKGIILFQYNSLVKIIEDTKKITMNKYENKSTTAKAKKEPDKGRPTDENIAEILVVKKTLQNYNSQCDLFLFSKLLSVFRNFSHLQSITTLFVENKLNSEHCYYKDRLKILESSYFNKAQENLNQGIDERDQILKSLVLPLAHPTHHEKLKHLHNKVISVAKEQKAILEKELISYKDSLQNHHIKYVEKLKILKEILNDTQNHILNGGHIDILIKDLNTIVNDSTESYLDSESTIDGKETIVGSPTDKIVSVNQNNYEIENTKYLQSIWSDDDSPETIQSSRLDLERETSISLEKYHKSVEINIDKIATSNLKESIEQVQTLFDKANNNFKYNCRIIDKWVKNFEYNMEQAQNIFTSACN